MKATFNPPNQPHRWINTDEMSKLIGVQPQTLRRWRLEDRRAGRLWPRPGKGGLYWRLYGRAARYLLTEDLLTPAAEERV